VAYASSTYATSTMVVCCTSRPAYTIPTSKKAFRTLASDLFMLGLLIRLSCQAAHGSPGQRVSSIIAPVD
jgi:hypothetical protein